MGLKGVSYRPLQQLDGLEVQTGHNMPSQHVSQ
jgi:hypothetical protein